MCHTFLVSYFILLSWPEWFTSCFVKVQDIFEDYSSNREERRGMTRHRFFSNGGLRKFVLGNELFVLRLYFIRHLIAKRPTKISWLPLQSIFRSEWLKPQLKSEIWNYTNLFWVLVKEGVGNRFFVSSL